MPKRTNLWYSLLFIFIGGFLLRQSFYIQNKGFAIVALAAGSVFMISAMIVFGKTFGNNKAYIIMKREEQSVRPKVRATGKVPKQPKNIGEAEQRAAELPGNEASVVAELKNRGK